MNKLNIPQELIEKQGAIKAYQKEIEKYLPEGLEELAKQYGAIQRKRGISSASDLLQVFLIYAVSKISIRLLALSSFCLGIASISDTAWQKRFKKSLPLLTAILNNMLPVVAKQQQSQSPNQREIYLIDGSIIVQEGKSKDSYRIHMSYNLNRGRMNELKITDNHTAENFSHYTIEENAIYIADAGYGKATLFDYLTTKKADAILRITPNQLALYDESGEKINMVTVLDTKKSVVELNCFIKANRKLKPIRIIASQLPEDKQEIAIKRKKRKASKNQSKIKAETLEYAKWVIIATSLDDTYSSFDIFAIYRLRWQIELLFKRIKQNMNAHTIKPGSKAYAFALITLWLIVWCITEKQVFQFEKLLIEKDIDRNRISKWSLCAFFYQRVIFSIQSVWALLIDPCNSDVLCKYLLNHSSSRLLQCFAFDSSFDSSFDSISSVITACLSD